MIRALNEKHENNQSQRSERRRIIVHDGAVEGSEERTGWEVIIRKIPDRGTEILSAIAATGALSDAGHFDQRQTAR